MIKRFAEKKPYGSKTLAQVPRPLPALGLVLAAAVAAISGCSTAPVPIFDGGPTDLPALYDGGTDLPGPDLSPQGPVVLATATAPILDGVTLNGVALAYHDGTDAFVVPTSPGTPPLKIAQGLVTGGMQVSNNAILAFSQYNSGTGVAHLTAYVPGQTQAHTLEEQVYVSRDAVAASTDSNFVGYIYSVDGQSGDLTLRRSDAGAMSQSPLLLRNVDLVRCPIELHFYDQQHLVVFFCLHSDPTARSQIAIADATTGIASTLSLPLEDVDQVRVVPGGRVLWVDKLSSGGGLGGTLQSATIDGGVRQTIEKNVPVKSAAQLTLSPAGDVVFYLTGVGALSKVSARGEFPTVTLSPTKVGRISVVSRDGGIVAVTRPTGVVMAPDRLSLIDTVTKTSVDAPLSVALIAAAFTGDSTLSIYLSASGDLFSFPVRASSGTQPDLLFSKVSLFAPLNDAQVFFLHDATLGKDATASVLDAHHPMPVVDKDRGLVSSPSGSFVITADRGRLLYVKGTTLYATNLP